MKLPGFVFSNKWIYRLARHIIFWLARISFLIFAMIARGGITYLSSNLENLGYMAKFAVFVIATTNVPFCYITIYFLAPRYLLKKKYFLFVLNLLFTIIFVQALGNVSLYWFFGLHNLTAADFYLLIWSNSINFLSDGCVSACAVLLCLKLFKTWYIKQAEGQMLMKLNAEAEMQILKAQIHPHFLFNTLNNIYSFTLNKSPKAKELVENLNNIMRYMINDCNAELMPLEKEIKMLRDYIELEKVRYGNRLRY